MAIVLNAALLIFGFLLLIKGSDYFVDGASALSLKLHLSPITIGLSVVAFGTSSPELIINIFAAIRKSAGISFGNIIGSNILNVFLVLGIAGLITPLKTNRNTVWREIPFLVISIIALFISVNDKIFNNAQSDFLSRGEGLVLLLFFLVFLGYLFIMSKATAENTPAIKQMKTHKIIFYLFSGLLGLVIGGKLTVDSSVFIAQLWGLSDRLIGLTVIAVGSSLPEIFTTVAAARKGHYDLAVGNAIGSSIFNILFILPLTAVIFPLQFSSELNFDIVVMFVSSVLLFLTMFTGKKRSLDRWEAKLFIFFYLVYISILIFTKRS